MKMPQEQHQTPDDLREIERRLRVLREQTADGAENREQASPHPIGRAMWIAFNVVSDLIAGVICGLVAGYGLDKWLDTRPVFIAVFLIMGCAAGVLNAVRFLRLYDERQREKREVPAEKE